MTTLERSLRRLHQHVSVTTRDNIHVLFDANKYGKLLPLPEFTLEFKNPSGNLDFSFHGNHDFWTTRTEEKLQAEILSCEPLTLDPRPWPVTALARYWRIKVRFRIQFMEPEDGGTRFFVEEVETFLDYDSVTKKSKLHDDRFYRKFMRWLEPDEGIAGGLYFNGRRIARIAEPKSPWELAKDKPFADIAPLVSVRTFNTFGRMFQHDTIGDIGDFFDRSTDEEIFRVGIGVSVSTLEAMKQALISLGYQPKK